MSRTINYAGAQQVYDKNQIDTMLSGKVDNSELANYAEKNYVDTELAKKVNSTELNAFAKKADVYDKAAIDQKFSSVPSDEWVNTEINNAVEPLSDEIINIRDNVIGNLDNLDEHIDNSNVVAAINDVFEDLGHVEELEPDITAANAIVAINHVSNKTGLISRLETEDKSSVVNAINEIYGDLDDNIDNLDALSQKVNNEVIPSIAATNARIDGIETDIDDKIAVVDTKVDSVNTDLNNKITTETQNRVAGDQAIEQEITAINTEITEIKEEAETHAKAAEHTSTGYFDENLLYPAVKYTADMSDQAYEGNFYELPAWLNLENKPVGAKFAYVADDIVKFTASVPMLSGTIYGEPEAVAQNKAAFDTITWLEGSMSLSAVTYNTPTIEVEDEASVATQEVQAFVDYKQNAINERLDARSSENRAMIRELQKGGGTSFTYIIDSDQKLDDFLNQVAGNDYSYVLVKRGTWTASNAPLTVDCSAVKCLIGEIDAELSGLNQLKNLNNIQNIIFNSTPVAATQSENIPSAFLNCTNIKNCEFNLESSYSSHDCMLRKCSYIRSCIVYASNTTIGFVSCSNIVECSSEHIYADYDHQTDCYLDCVGLFRCTYLRAAPGHVTITAAAFKYCKEVHFCKKASPEDRSSTDVTYKESYASSTEDSRYACADTPEGGWNS